MLNERKTHNNLSLKNNQPTHLVQFGKFGIKSITFGIISQKQLDAIEWALMKKIKSLANKKNVKFWNLLTLNLNLTKLSLESRMGKGKGSIYTKSVFLKPGTMLFEFDRISFQNIKEVFKFIKKKLPIKVILISNN